MRQTPDSPTPSIALTFGIVDNGSIGIVFRPSGRDAEVPFAFERKAVVSGDPYGLKQIQADRPAERRVGDDVEQRQSDTLPHARIKPAVAAVAAETEAGSDIRRDHGFVAVHGLQ